MGDTVSNDGHGSEKLDKIESQSEQPHVQDGLLTGLRLYLVFLSLMLSVFVSFQKWHPLTSDVRFG